MTELLAKLECTEKVRLMPDETHLCSVAFLNKCVDVFSKRLEQEAIECVKKGLRPDKLLAKQDSDS